MTMFTARRPPLLLVGVLLCGLTACGSPVDKQGSPSTAPTVLTLGTADPDDPELAFFVDAVDRASQHRVKVEVDGKTYASETPGGEQKLVDAVRSGAVGAGYVPSRDWAAAGDPGFAALHSPFLVSTTAAELDLARGPVAADLLGALAPGLHGLALVPGEVRRILSRKPLTTAADLRGIQIRINDSPQTQDLLTRLGATPVQGLTATQTGDRLRAGTIDAVETSPSYATANSYNFQAPYLTSFGLLPKMQVLVVNGTAWTGLADQDRSAVQDAATQTLAHAVAAVPATEATALSQLCAKQTVVVKPTDDVLRAMATAATGGAAPSPHVMAISTGVAGSGPRSDAGPLPQECRVATTAADAEAQATGSADATAATSQAFPTGTFVVTTTPAEMAAGAAEGSNAGTDVTFTWHFQPDGTVTETQDPDFPDQGSVAGTWKAMGDRLHLVYVQGGDGRFDETVRWSYFKGELHFEVLDVQDAGSRVIYGQPWRKTA